MKEIPFSPLENWVEKLNYWGRANVPFYFLCDFSCQNTWAGSKNEADELGILFSFKGSKEEEKEKVPIKKYPIDKRLYFDKFKFVQEQLKRGNSFLVNLTQKTKIDLNQTLEDIFHRANAPYKLLVKEKFVVFSPETFIQLENGIIRSHPMKGTISATIPNSKSILLNDSKENAEHATIVDLIRNDISQIAFPIEVKKYKYLDLVKTNEGDLWQMSSIIQGKISSNFENKIGSILQALLPAGSITGAPKNQTLEIIQEVEGYDRGFYTGIMGYYDGNRFDSAVLIRYIEQEENQFYFKSGGGITVFSDLNKEYDELIQKIYLPF